MIRSAVALFAAMTAMTLGSARADLVTVDVTKRHQTIEGWGTSMVFWNLSHTPYQDPEWREAYRDLGLNMLRVNINKEVLVDTSGDMAVPVLLGPDLESNVAKMNFGDPKTKVYGEMAVWLRQNALEPGRVRICGSVWSPPHWMKGPTGTRQYHVKNRSVRKPTPWLSGGKSGDSVGGRLLQTPENLEQFARYLAAWVRGFEKHYGVPIYAASIQNELSFENPFDSATYATGADGKKKQWWQYAAALKAVKDEFTQQRISTKVIGPHMAHVGRRPSNPWGLWHQMSYIEAVKTHRDPELASFLFAYNSNGYLNGSEESVKMWAGYYRGKAAVPADWARWTTAPGVARDGKPVWVSEAGGADASWLTGTNGSPGEGAITVAQKMHNALVHANASAYLYWQMSGGSVVETEHTLLGKEHIDSPNQSKKYSAFKHFSRHVRPGAVRVGATFVNGKSSVGGQSEYDTANSLSVSAYVHEEDRTITMVFVNMLPSNELVHVQLPRTLSVKKLHVHLTSSSASFAMQNDLVVSSGRVSLVAPAHAVVTLHGELLGR
jgi:O-glycosyl hydrolase